ncbi:PadR family transcriptional regulator [Lactobacillus rodentium]|uniref:PadR family transcriptional regulator n=1 Tax=Lactobacillus rodentium TaxID=947835 RepID=A0A2Z6TCA5_9LACO|nr:PadR family transcriptional regulator [Lactobacillus rodentium]MCR1894050.1 PadR family transcriptional regulator [Lactobacillus rodentium]GBG04345.1 PadR family transcriptional regulator [Lactobacillus rodentium]
MPKERILPFIILGIIDNHPKITGREITNEFNTEIGDFWKASHSQIYPELKRMLTDHWIKVTMNPDNAKEKFYDLTSEGKEVLNHWLTQAVTKLPIHQDLFSLKLFFIKKANDPRIKDLLVQQIKLLKDDLEHLLERKKLIFAEQAAIDHHYGHYLILTRAISRTEGQINWLKEELSKLNN